MDIRIEKKKGIRALFTKKGIPSSEKYPTPSESMSKHCFTVCGIIIFLFF